MSGNPHPYAATKLADWRIKALLAEVDRQRLARLSQAKTGNPHRSDAASPVALAGQRRSSSCPAVATTALNAASIAVGEA